MRGDRAPTGLWVVMLASLGCVGTSFRGDARTVSDVTHTPLPELADEGVDPSVPAEARALLGRPLDADAAVRVAVLGNRELRAELREMGIARGRLAQAGVVPNPTFEIEVLPERTSAYSLRAEYDLTGLVLAPLRARAAEPELEAARYEAAGKVVELGHRVRAAFYACSAAEEELALANAWLEAFAASREAARALAAAGNTRKLDFEIEDAAYQEARVQVADVELAARDAHEALARLLSLHGADVGFTIAATLPPAPAALDLPDGLESRVLRASFEMQARKSELEAVGRSAGLSRAEGWLPDVAVDGHVLEPRAGVTGVDTSPVYSGGVKFTVPIFDHKQGQTASREAAFDGLLERYYGAASALRSRARVVADHLQITHGRALLYQNEVLPARARATQESVLQYNAMQLGIHRLLQIRKDELSSTMAAVEAKRAYWTARAALDALLAGGSVKPEDVRGSMTTATEDGGGD